MKFSSLFKILPHKVGEEFSTENICKGKIVIEHVLGLAYVSHQNFQTKFCPKLKVSKIVGNLHLDAFMAI